MARPHKGRGKAFEARTAIGATRSEMAALLGVSVRTIQAMEIGERNVTPEMEVRIAKAVGLDVRAVIERKVQAYRAKLLREAGL